MGIPSARLAALLGALHVAWVCPVRAIPAPTQTTEEPPDTSGRPKIVLDRLDFPADVPNASAYKKSLAQILARETRRAVWGAGRDSTITYRYRVTRFALREQDGVVRVHCSAVGTLPKGKTAKGSLAFSGDARQKNAVVQQVLEIVARGVITRLAELERIRRGDLEPE